MNPIFLYSGSTRLSPFTFVHKDGSDPLLTLAHPFYWPLHFIWSFGHRTLIDLRFNHNQPFRSSNHKMVAYGHSQPLLIKLRCEAYNLNLTSSKAARLLFSFRAVPQLSITDHYYMCIYVCVCLCIHVGMYVMCVCVFARALIYVSLGSYQWYEVLYISILRI